MRYAGGEGGDVFGGTERPDSTTEGLGAVRGGGVADRVDGDGALEVTRHSAAQATNNPRPRSSRVRRRVSYDHDHDHDHDYHARYSHPIPLRLVSIETQTDHRPSAPHATCDRPGS